MLDLLPTTAASTISANLEQLVERAGVLPPIGASAPLLAFDPKFGVFYVE